MLRLIIISIMAISLWGCRAFIKEDVIDMDNNYSYKYIIATYNCGNKPYKLYIVDDNYSLDVTDIYILDGKGKLHITNKAKEIMK